MQRKDILIDRTTKIISIICFAFILIALFVIAKSPPASGYEISIYDAYPWYFWFFLVASIAGGIGILVHQAFAKEKSNCWVAGLSIIIIANTIFLLLPEFRGYAFYGRGDTPTHLGHIRDILNTGHVGESNFYPIEHLLGASLVRVAGVSLENITSLFFVLFSGIYIANMYLLAKSAGKHSGQALLTIAFASPLIYSFFHVNIHPNILSLFMVPCLLYFYHKRELHSSNRLENTIVLLLLAFLITFFHPVTTLFVIIIFFTFGLAYVLYSRFLSHGSSEHGQYGIIGKNFFGVSLIMFITFFIWYFSYVSICQSFKRVADWLLYQIGKPLVMAQLEPLAEAELTPFQTFELFVNRYGAVFLLLFVSSISLIYVLKRILSKNRDLEPVTFTYSVQFLMALFIGTIMLFGYFVEYNLIRVARLPLLMGTILSGLVIYDFIASYVKNNPKKLIFTAVTGIVIIAMAALSLGSVYNSPRTCKLNSQVTWMDVVGTKWFERSKSLDIPVIVNSAQSLHRFEDYNFGIDSSPITRARIDRKRLPSHFGYAGNNTIAEALDFRDRYMVLFKLDKVAPLFFPENVRPKVYQWTTEDFKRLRIDSYTAQIYDNGGFEVWRVYGK